MASLESAILQAAETQLLAANTAAGTNVFVSREEPIEGAHELPAIAIHCPRTTAEPLGRPYQKFRSNVQLVVQCIAARSAATSAAAEKAAELTAHALENQALVALLAYPRNWYSGIETITGYTSESVAPSPADYVYRCRQTTIELRCVAEFVHVEAEVALEDIFQTYTMGAGDDAPTVEAVTQIEE